MAGATAGGLAIARLDELSHWILGALAVSVAVIQLWRMFRNLRDGHWGLDILAVSAVAATVALGEFWAAFVVTLMIVGGQALEDYASAQARRQLTALMARAPRGAHRVNGDDIEDLAVDDVVVGDTLLVKAGEAVPVDGTLLDNEAEFDESSLTGESLPVTHHSNDSILSGAVNGSAPIHMVARARASESQYQRIIAMVDEAGSVRGRFLRLADRLAIPFTGLAYALAATAWIVSGEPARFAEVLVVATPCPLLVAAPTALVAGMGRAAREGVIVKSGETLERIAAARGVAMDKTGTLTYGSPQVVRTEPAAGFDAESVLAVAAAAEQISAHVLADAIVAEARRRQLHFPTLTAAHEITGNGIRAQWGDREVVVGKLPFVNTYIQSGVAAADLGVGEMAVYVGIGRHTAGRLVLRDEVRADAPAAVRELAALGIKQIVMLTGDGPDNARRVAMQVGITDVRAGMLPADKVAAVAGMTSRPTMMIGDGVNDAPVLAAADVGVAMGARGSTAASETADVVLLVDELGRIPRVIRTAARTMRIARQSIWIGIGLSVALMIVATFGVIPAIVGALAQEAIDVITILNGLRAGRDQRNPRALRLQARGSVATGQPGVL